MEGAEIKNLEFFDSQLWGISDCYHEIVKIFKKYMDTSEENYKILSLWTLGAFFHKSFVAFPYLFLNAMRGSGKSRLLKLLAYILKGTHTTNLTEAVLFRENTPIMIDEFENIGRKEKSGLRELLNLGYKCGGVVKRSRKNPKTEEFSIDTFQVYRPIAMANIAGMEDVLESRCITLLLEKSFRREITKKVELFQYDLEINKILDGLVQLVYVDAHVKYIYNEVGYLLNTNYTDNIIYSTTTTYTNCTSDIIYEKLEKSDLQGRDLELWLPIFIISSLISEELLEEIIEIAERFAKERQESDIIENRDISLLSFLVNYIGDKPSGEFLSISGIVNEYLAVEPEIRQWFNSHWVGNSLKRNNLIIEKRRLARGVEIILNFQKIEDKAKKFGIDIEKSRAGYRKQKEEFQQTLKERPDWHDKEEAQMKFGGGM